MLSQRDLQNVLRAIPVPVVIMSASSDFIIHEVSDLWLNFTGLERHDIIGKDIRSIFSDDYRSTTYSRIQDALSEVLSQKTTNKIPRLQYDVCTPHKKQNKGLSFVSAENIPVADDRGRAMFIIHKIEPLQNSNKDVSQRAAAKDPNMENDLKGEYQFRLEQQRFLDMFREAPVSMCILKGEDHIFEKTNVLYDRLIQRKHVIGKTVRQVFPELEGQGWFRWLDQVYKTGQTFASDEELFRFYDSEEQQHKERYLNFMYQPFKNHLGEVEGIFYFGVDVTEHVLARKKIEESERRYRQIVETAQEGIWLMDSDHRTLFVNKKMGEILGYEATDMIGKSIFDFIDETEKLRLTQIIAPKAHSVASSFELRFIPKSGETVWGYFNTTRITEEKGEYSGLLAMVTDITARKKSDEELNKLSLIARSTTNAIIITNPAGKIEWVNDAFTRITEYTFEEVTGKTTAFLYGKETDHATEKLILEQVERHKAFECEILKYKKSGDPFWVEVQGRPVFNADGQLNCYFNMETDITERKHAYRKLIKTENQVRTFARQLNHMLEDERSRIAREIHDEFGQQLMGLKMSLSYLDKLQGLPAEAGSVIRELRSGVENTFKSLRNFSNELRPGILDTLGLIPSIEWLARSFEKKSGIPCSVKMRVRRQVFEKDLSINYFRICQEALTNILKHAEASEVIIEIAHEQEDLCMKITDNGKGMLSEKLENPFSLGLLGMHERARLVGGALEIYSQPGKGTHIQLSGRVNGN